MRLLILFVMLTFILPSESFSDPYKFETAHPGRFKKVRYGECEAHARYADRYIAFNYMSKEYWQRVRSAGGNEICLIVVADTLEMPVLTIQTFDGGGDLVVRSIEALHYGSFPSTEPKFTRAERIWTAPDLGNKNQVHILPMAGPWEIDYYAVRLNLNGSPADTYLGLHTIKLTEDFALATVSTAMSRWIGSYVKEALNLESEGADANLMAELFLNATGSFIMEYALSRDLERASQNAIVSGAFTYIGDRVGIPSGVSTFASAIIPSVTRKAFELWDRPERDWKVR